MRTLAALLLVVAACTPGDEASENTQETCAGPLGDPMSLSGISALDACCQVQGGQAHCLPDSKVPAEIRDFLEPCESGGFCIPDGFLKTGASQPPASCTAFGGDGVCLSKCIPQVAENAGLLKPDTCTGPDDLCVPCINPLTQMPSGACDLRELAVCEGETNDPVNPGGCDDHRRATTKRAARR